MSSREMSFSPPRGMRDFYPDDMALRNDIFDAWNTAALRFGFDEYDSCVVETLEILKRKAGEDITKQIYTFRDKGGRELALRPEITPTLARMVASRYGSLNFPLKWFSIAQCFRYERMSRGRKREHYQWNLDIVGEESLAAEVEVIAAAVHALSILGFDKRDFRVSYSSRALLTDLLLSLGIPSEFHSATFLALDKRGKISDRDIEKVLSEAGLDARNIERAFSLLNISSLDEAKEILGSQPPAADPGSKTRSQSHARDNMRKPNSQAEIDLFLKTATSCGIQEVLEFDISVVRGLAYYTGIVFEAFDTNRKFRAIFGGGRYDNLLGDIGGKAATGVGLGFGDVVVAEVLADAGRIPSHQTRAEFAVGYMNDEQRTTAVSIASALRNNGRNVDLALHAERAKNFFARAGKTPFKEAIYIGPDDVARKSVRIKNLDTRVEREVLIGQLTEHDHDAGSVPES